MAMISLFCVHMLEIMCLEQCFNKEDDSLKTLNNWNLVCLSFLCFKDLF